MYAERLTLPFLRCFVGLCCMATPLVAQAKTHKPAKPMPPLASWQPVDVPRVDVQQPQPLAITVDDLPVHGDLPPGVTREQIGDQFLEAFKAAGLPPVYGMVNDGGFERTSPPMVVLKKWIDSGNRLGNHTANHPSLDEVTAASFEADIAADEPLLSEFARGTNWHWFRYPFLQEGNTAAKRDAVRAYLRAHGYQIAEVSLDFEDYLWNDPYARCVAKHDDAAIAQLERTYLATANEYIDVARTLNQRLYARQIPTVLLLHIGAFDARMLPRLIALLRARGFAFTTLEQAQNDEAYHRELHAGDDGGGGLQEIQAAAQHTAIVPNTKPWQQLDAICR